MMRRRTLLAGAPAVAVGAIVTVHSYSEPSVDTVAERQHEADLTGMPLAAHYGKLAGEALASCEWSHEFDMQVKNGEVWFHNREEPRDAIAHHLRMVRREIARLGTDNVISELDRWQVGLAKTYLGIDL